MDQNLANIGGADGGAAFQALEGVFRSGIEDIVKHRQAGRHQHRIALEPFEHVTQGGVVEQDGAAAIGEKMGFGVSRQFDAQPAPDGGLRRAPPQRPGAPAHGQNAKPR